MKVNITKDHPILQEILIKTAELKRFLDTDIIHVSDRKEIIKNLESYEKQHLALIELLTEKAKEKKQELIQQHIARGVLRRVGKI
tara:strand:- start:219 stop:473 length:255 start_codon:yes stop_codon:yes gene_type:complete